MCDHVYIPSDIPDYEKCLRCGTYHSRGALEPERLYGEFWGRNHSSVWEQAWNVDMHTVDGVSKNRFILDRIETERGAALDIGCAPGRLLYWLTWAARFKRVVGIDPANPNDIRALSAFYGEIVTGMFPEKGIQFADESFDFVVGVDVFEHSFCPYSFVKECSRLVSRGGQLFLMLPLSDDLPFDHHCWNAIEHVYVHSRQHMTEILEGNRFGRITFDRWATGHDTVSARKG